MTFFQGEMRTTLVDGCLSGQYPDAALVRAWIAGLATGRSSVTVHWVVPREPFPDRYLETSQLSGPLRRAITMWEVMRGR